MNREAVPLIVGILFPVIFVGLIVLYLYNYDVIEYLRKINIIYYILVLPFGLGLLVVFFWFREHKD